MTTPIAIDRRTKSEVIENVLIKGDLGRLSPEERSEYYLRVCESVGLNPLTQPLAYMTLNGKLTLYALRTCTDQLRAIHKVSVVELSESERGDVYIVTAKVQNAEGRTDVAKGAVSIANLKGDILANAVMKAETKAKRRATLSICGLGLLDETEIETIPGAAPAKAVVKELNPKTGRMIDPNSSNQLRTNGVWTSFLKKLKSFVESSDLDGLEQWFAQPETKAKIEKWPENWQTLAQEEYEQAQESMWRALAAQPDEDGG